MQQQMRLSMVMAMDRNRLIGKDGGMPWHLSAELAYFKRVTMGKVLIMGRRTYVSIGKPLPGRVSIVVSASGVLTGDAIERYQAEGKLHLCRSLDEALQLSDRLTAHLPLDGGSDDAPLAGTGSSDALKHREAAIVGGAQMCEAAMPHVDRLYLTVIDSEFEGDTWLNCFQESDWQEQSVSHEQINDVTVAYRVLERR